MRHRSMVVHLAFALALGVAGSAAAQDTSATASRVGVPQDSVDAGRAAGAAAAQRYGTGGYFAVSLLAGSPLGFAAPVVLAEADPDVIPGALTAAGAAGVVGVTLHAARAGVSLPEADEARLQQHGAAYRRAFRETYTTEVRRRRKRAALWGSLTGSAVGFGALLILLQNIGT